MAEEIAVIDAIDNEILRVLSEDARISYQSLGERVHLSANAAAERVRRLVRNGVIRRFTIDVNHASLGRDLSAVIDVRVRDAEVFQQGALARDEVTWMAHVTGQSDFRVHVATRGSRGLSDLLEFFRDELGTSETLTTVVLERFR